MDFKGYYRISNIEDFFYRIKDFNMFHEISQYLYGFKLILKNYKDIKAGCQGIFTGFSNI